MKPQLKQSRFTTQELETIKMVFDVAEQYVPVSVLPDEKRLHVVARISAELAYRSKLISRLNDKRAEAGRPKTVFNPDQLADIKAKRYTNSTPVSINDLADMYNVSYGVMWQICDEIRQELGLSKNHKVGRPKKKLLAPIKGMNIDTIPPEDLEGPGFDDDDVSGNSDDELDVIVVGGGNVVGHERSKRSGKQSGKGKEELQELEMA